MEAMHEIGAIDKQTMREHISQPVFARYLNVSKNLVSDWERGVKKPGGPALRLLTVIQKKGLEAIA
jgi:putative transcriptional regulator